MFIVPEIVVAKAVERRSDGLYRLEDGAVVFKPRGSRPGAAERTAVAFNREPGFLYYLDERGNIVRLPFMFTIDGGRRYDLGRTGGLDVNQLVAPTRRHSVEKVAQLGLRLEPQYLYFVCVNQVVRLHRNHVGQVPAPFEHVASAEFARDDSWIYYLDETGDIVRGQ
jgi:hypothetical protein